MNRPKLVFLPTMTLISVILGVCYGILMSSLDMRLEGGAIAVLGLGPLYLYLDRKCTPGFIIGPSSFIYILHVLGYSIGPLAQRYILHSEYFIVDGMILAQWGAVIGLLTYAIVYINVFRAVSRRLYNGKNERLALSPEGSKWGGYTSILLAISVLILFYGYVSGASRRIGGLAAMENTTLMQTIVSSFLFVKIIVFFFLGYLAIKLRGRWLVLAAFAYVAYAGFETLEGNRGPLVYSLLMLSTGVVWAGYSIRKTVVALCLSAMLFVPLAGVVNYYRSYTSLTQYEEGFIERMSAFSQAMRELKTIEKEGSEIAGRALIIAITAETVDRIMTMTPEVIPHAGFEGLNAIFYIYMPLLIAPDRPEIGDGNIIAATYGVGKGTNSTFSYVPAVGEGYRRFGWFGIPLIYALSGIIFGTALAVFWVRRGVPECFAMLLFLVLQAPGVWSFTFNYAFYFALFYVPKYYIYFVILRKLQGVFSSCYTRFRRIGFVQRVGANRVEIGARR